MEVQIDVFLTRWSFVNSALFARKRSVCATARSVDAIVATLAATANTVTQSAFKVLPT